jgi:transposase
MMSGARLVEAAEPPRVVDAIVWCASRACAHKLLLSEQLGAPDVHGLDKQVLSEIGDGQLLAL